MVRALLEARAIGEPDDEAQHEPRNRADETDDGTVRAHDETHVAVGRACGLEHADRAQPALREDGEAADGDEGDEQHAEHERGKRDRLRVERVRLRDRRRGLHVVADGAQRHARRVEQGRDLLGVSQLSRRDEGELVEEALGVLDDADHLCASTAPTRQLSPTLRWNAEAIPLVTATSLAPDG